MKATVRKVEVKKGNSRTTGEPYLFSNVFIIFDDNKTADYITVDSEVCHPDKIKPGIKAEVYFSQSNNKRVTLFEPIGLKEENDVNHPEGYVEVDVSDYDLDPKTGEMKEKNKK